MWYAIRRIVDLDLNRAGMSLHGMTWFLFRIKDYITDADGI